MEGNAPKEFNSWAIVEMFGHTKEVGFVSTQYFGPACLFQIDVPELPEREIVLSHSRYINSVTFAPAGTKVKISAMPKRSRLIGPGSIYSITPCTEPTAMKAIDAMADTHREMLILEYPDKQVPALPDGNDGIDEDDEIEI
jgi:hypothetical protein